MNRHSNADDRTKVALGERNAAILQAALDGIITMDHEGKVVEFNPAASRIFGYSEMEAIGRHLSELIVPFRLREQHQAGLTRYLSSGQSRIIGQRLEMPAMRADGTEIPVELSIVRIATEGPPLFTGYIRDLSAQKKTARALKESHEQLRALIQNAPAALAMFDRNMCYIASSHRWMVDYALEEREITGHSHYEIFPEIPERWKEMHRRALTGEVLRSAEDRFERSDGSVQWLRWEIMPWRDTDREIGGIVMLTEDITERKSADEKLRWQAQLLDSVRESIVATDINGRIIYWGRGAEKLYGYTADEALHQPYRQFAGSLDTSDDEEFVRHLHAEGSWRGEKMQKRKDGTRFWSSVIISVITDNTGQPCGYIGIDHDITDVKSREEERRDMDRRLEQTQRLESLGVLAGGIAHDFNNILTAILGHAEIALDELAPLAPARESLMEIKKSSIRAAELCTQLLAYTGKGPVETQNISLNELIEEMMHMLKTCISKKCMLNLHLSKNLPLIHGDPSQVRQIVMNLIINASDAIGDESGVISISTGLSNFTGEYQANGYLIEPIEPGTYVYIEVSDTGCGMDQETQQRIFEPFFTTKFAGRGLGLSAVVGIVRSHHGAIRVYSEVGHGTSFKVLFPAISDSTPKQDPAKAGVGGESWRGKGTVLVVDDEDYVRAISCRMLNSLGLRTITAVDGRNAVEIYRNRRSEIDLVLLDMTMPNMNGAEAFSELKQIDPDACVVLASGYSEIDIASRFAGKGIGGFLQKPYTLHKLRKIISPLLPTA